jgi:hypothetical protein
MTMTCLASRTTSQSRNGRELDGITNYAPLKYFILMIHYANNLVHLTQES